ncbi:MAG: bifunctional diaminohydroxyphosphoribosylaminopyrimidine deaminase/5-amino-6-(5-phosphoribosylamino)uracil reductase RibD [SAR202 cluster bacterium]|nr:bifunctional diaminohydroxyphosphoribosylaminopyrimidine deaminase/5-amino-6-(5-phosphoribosylamino)uracil reductase RibD [SAR202 cluster bacterium]MDP6511902.1 bifunctional diaminohydroxyphosphoribosylaminopyrimidine deaminase/5-amino-6-(5-phosphoribosylamino)uracil reductase RibD [SAR202 cluster bacterium]MDP6713831.1 bifunctional diaminohydroxyphosphoribosylaminopyrimidine deaminase/5-amino-6-(5-phosphoribosylamino)uracil reductase RibD [SAR202 cluster bacterium]
MRRALELARRAVGVSSPNPPVGAVVVRDGEVVGEGWTQPPGQAHAEVVALQDAGDRARGATLYVTLEPHSYHGRTPPCTQRIIDAGISEVYASILDPNPQVAGRGAAILREADIAVHLGDGEDDARELAEPHAKHVTTGLPFVTVKFAASLDGKIATRTGDSKWITGEESRAYVHQLRAASDAIMAGIGTVLADDPQLTARNPDAATLPHQPLRVIVDSRGRTPLNSRLLTEPGETLIATADSGLEIPGAEVVSMPVDDGRVDLCALIQELGRREITSLFVEGGGTLIGSLFDLRLVDKVVAFVAPLIIGGQTAPSPVGGQGSERMADALRLSRVKLRQFGDDVAIIGYCEA